MKFSHHIIIGQTLTDLQGKLDSILAAHPQQQVVFKRYFLPDESLRQQFPAEKGAVSYIIQPVLCEGSVALWLVLCEGAKVHDQGSETILEGEGIRLIITASLTCPEGTSEQQTRSIFSAYAAGLERHGLTLEGNCVRTWLFCDDIDHQYAGLVKARREFFAACGLTAQTHFIASTGIAGRPAGAGTPEGAYSLVTANEGVPAPAAARAAETARAAIVQMDALAIEGAFTQRYLYART
ncbi:MAG: RidA family protein, partial [Bacteroidales bacterium]|nr:RidA family protein [Bacteroidales bacterium]